VIQGSCLLCSAGSLGMPPGARVVLDISANLVIQGSCFLFSPAVCPGLCLAPDAGVPLVFVLCLLFLFSSSQLLVTSRELELCLFLPLSEIAEHLPLFIKNSLLICLYFVWDLSVIVSRCRDYSYNFLGDTCSGAENS
jgi:hypothetical protein